MFLISHDRCCFSNDWGHQHTPSISLRRLYCQQFSKWLQMRPRWFFSLSKEHLQPLSPLPYWLCRHAIYLLRLQPLDVKTHQGPPANKLLHSRVRHCGRHYKLTLVLANALSFPFPSVPVKNIQRSLPAKHHRLRVCSHRRQSLSSRQVFFCPWLVQRQQARTGSQAALMKSISLHRLSLGRCEFP